MHLARQPIETLIEGERGGGREGERGLYHNRCKLDHRSCFSFTPDILAKAHWKLIAYANAVSYITLLVTYPPALLLYVYKITLL